MEDWQDISTAPKDGTRVLVWDGETVVARWGALDMRRFHPDTRQHEQVYGWRDAFQSYTRPTHWMPLPSPPQIPGEQS